MNFLRNLNKKMKWAILITFLVFQSPILMACEACNKNQPWWDYFVVVIMVVVTIYSLYATIKCFVVTKEVKYKSIKNLIVTQE
jgi:nicotinamide riboside transporter PnuC